MRLLILLILLILLNSCGQTPQEYYENQKSTELNGLIIETKINKGGYSLLIAEKSDTTYIWNTFVVNAHNLIAVGDSIYKKKNELTYKMTREDSIFFLDASQAFFDD
ncbi:hypothetical protein [Mesoflavibacter zeaxanthinifaciens]|uniref:hypothetical protein n=1 Tax=Mesoflavibacter zeaxanthinifaciens TaxID=393060 RepID=UPI003A8DF26C